MGLYILVQNFRLLQLFLTVQKLILDRIRVVGARALAANSDSISSIFGKFRIEVKLICFKLKSFT